MTRIISVLALIAAVAASGILAGPLLNADQHEEISIAAITALPTFAPAHHAKAAGRTP